ncbi:MAG: aldehyde dehydrogenase [bacterium]|nr:aldehyde dehydrogenase [bacterium]
MSEFQSILKNQQRFFRDGYTKSLEFRIEQLNTLKTLLKENEEALIDAVYQDFKKPPFETFGTEIGLIINEINFALKNLEKWIRPESVPSSLVNFPSKNYILKEPYGNVLIIAPWNYPIQLCLLPLVGALAAGNTAIIKPSELTSHTSDVIQTLIHKYFSADVVSVALGGVDVSSELLELPFNYIFFTGSTRVGKIIMQSAAKRLIPVTLELGGKTPCIVDESADLEISAKRIVWGKFVNAGQTCVAPDYLLVQDSIKDDFVNHLKSAVNQLYGEDPSKSDDYTRIINDAHFNRLASLLNNGSVLIGGQSDESERYIAPTILDNITWDDPVMQDEIFGPILPLLTFSDIDDAIAQIHRTTRPLALYLFTTKDDVEKKVLEQVSFGGGAINDTIAQLGNHHLSFGGVGASGFGSYHGKASFDSFSHQKSIMKKNFLVDIPIRYAPYDGKIKWLKTIFR